MTIPKKSALGKGLSALLSNDATDITSKSEIASAPAIAGSVANIAIDKIETNPFQPRTDFEETALRELSESIRQQGIIQPITVRKMGYDKYQIISGERRFRASKLAGLEIIPAYVRIANDQAMLEMALVENIQRENLNPIEMGISYKRLVDECNLSQEQLAEKVGKDRSTVTNYMRLLRLPPKIQAAIRDGQLSMGHARAIINVDDIGMQLKIYDDIITNNLSVRKVEELVRLTTGKKGKGGRPGKDVGSDFEYKNIQDRLASFYETKVELKQGAKGTGKIILSYYSTDDLKRLLDILEG
ncbi:MAG: ParB/RepB/Spo0J family partition protein [Bacteroidetes bacterium]|nr:ParB/RepB/Spo0J family partition protein [Bacteroidota bacterium]